MQVQLSELKNKLKKNEHIDLPMFWVGDRDSFIVKSYINALLTNLNAIPLELDDLGKIEGTKSNPFSDNGNLLYLHNYQKNDVLNDISLINVNLIIVGSELPKDIDISYVEFPSTLENWQVEDYVKSLAPGLDSKNRVDLCTICKYNIDRISSECGKLAPFSKEDQPTIFQRLKRDGAFEDLNSLGIFDLSKAIMRKTNPTIKNILKNIDDIDIEGTGLVTILIKNFKDLVNVQIDSMSSAASLGMKENQYRAISYNKGVYTNSEIINICDFLFDIDYKLKTGLLEMINNDLVTYVVYNIMRIGGSI